MLEVAAVFDRGQHDVLILTSCLCVFVPLCAHGVHLLFILACYSLVHGFRLRSVLEIRRR